MERDDGRRRAPQRGDPEQLRRIGALLRQAQELWPDQRICQIVVNAISRQRQRTGLDTGGACVFMVEDGALEEAMLDWVADPYDRDSRQKA